MSDTTELLSDASGSPAQPASGDTPSRAAKPRARRSGTGLSAKVLPELQKMAAELGISGTGRMRKSQLIAAIQEKQGGSAEGASASAPVAEAPAVAESAPAAERPTRARRERSRVKPADDPAPQAAEPAAAPAEPVAAAAP
ncbi:Rho termination factor N-terminal domain-containing protein, partial [Nonomuraea sp. NPDC050691]|uniref:Rho termination factor N-terminal domain-containing protein n=1 Tax=Nonomuraea sp. NPDC050691 TaxID=3155661 RepID=UPI0033CE0D72